MASDLGAHNPLRYRGYVYDPETGLYYLQSRYYDPELGRFLNADALASTGQGLLGNNMFAYCLNNPVAFFDDTGAVAKVCLSADWEIEDAPWKDGFGGSFYYINPRTSMCKNVPSDPSKNTSIDVVLSADGVSWYHGATVVKFSSDVISSFAIGEYIFLNRSQNTATTLKHEYGHVTQSRDYGLVKYTAIIFLPSVTYNVASRFNEELGDYYYSMPWEYDADMRGGNHRNYADGAERLRDEYFGRFG